MSLSKQSELLGPMVTFSDTMRDKTVRGAGEYDRVPTLMDCFCVH